MNIVKRLFLNAKNEIVNAPVNSLGVFNGMGGPLIMGGVLLWIVNLLFFPKVEQAHNNFEQTPSAASSSTSGEATSSESIAPPPRAVAPVPSILEYALESHTWRVDGDEQCRTAITFDLSQNGLSRKQVSSSQTQTSDFAIKMVDDSNLVVLGSNGEDETYDIHNEVIYVTGKVDRYSDNSQILRTYYPCALKKLS